MSTPERWAEPVPQRGRLQPMDSRARKRAGMSQLVTPRGRTASPAPEMTRSARAPRRTYSAGAGAGPGSFSGDARAESPQLPVLRATARSASARSLEDAHGGRLPPGSPIEPPSRRGKKAGRGGRAPQRAGRAGSVAWSEGSVVSSIGAADEMYEHKRDVLVAQLHPEGLDQAKRRLPNFVRDLLDDGTGGIRTTVDFEAHQIASGLPVTNATVQEVVDAAGGLTVMSLNDCDAVTDVGLYTIARAQTSLTSLTLSGLSQVSHVGLRSIALRCRDLETLDLARCGMINDLALRVISGGFWKLRHISLRQCPFISDGGLIELVTNCPRIESLNVSKCEAVSNASIREVARYCTALTKLNVGGCKLVSDRGVRAVAQGCARLASLRLSGCVEVTAKSVRGLCEYAGCLTTLNLAGCKYIDVGDVQTLVDGASALTDLNLRKCPRVRDRGMMRALREGRRIEALNLSRCERCSDATLEAIASGLSTLRTLNLADVPKVTEDGVRTVVTGCTRLTTLVLDGCGLVSRRFTMAIAEELPFVSEAADWVGLQPLPDSLSRIALTELRRRQVASATAMQRMWRGRMARLFAQRVKLRLRMERAAPQIQKTVRGFFGRKRARRRRRQLMRDEAALAIQCAFRGMKGRRAARRRARYLRLLASKNFCATEIQRVYRGHCGRRVAEHRRLAAFREKQMASAARTRRDQAVLLIQGNWKAVRSRRYLNMLRGRLRELKEIAAREDAAARVVSKMFRANLARRVVARMKYDRRMEAKRLAAAIAMQRIIRGRFARLDFWERIKRQQEATELAAARLLQRVWRGTRGRHMFAIMRSLAELRFFEHKAVKMIQDRWRTYRAHQFLAVLKGAREMEAQRLAAVVRIQRTYRGMRGREDFVVQKGLRKVEDLAAPIKAVIDELEEVRAGVQLRFVQIRKRVQEAEANLLAWSEELEEVKTIKAKWYDSEKVSGTMQRYRTSFLRKALRTHIRDMSKRLGPMRTRMNDLASELRDLDRAIRIKQRELRPLQEDVETQTRLARREKLVGAIQRERWAAKKIQALFRGARVRKAIAAGANYWVELWDDASGYVYYYHTDTEETTWSRPVDFDIYGGGSSTPTLTGWITYTDTETGYDVWYNVFDGQYRWEEPEDMYADPSLLGPTDPRDMGIDEKVIKDEEWFFGQELKLLTSRSEKRRDIGLWDEMYDPESEATYYVHRVTGEARWSLSPRAAHGRDGGDGEGDGEGERDGEGGQVRATARSQPPQPPEGEIPASARTEREAVDKSRQYNEQWFAAADKQALSARSRREKNWGAWELLVDETSGVDYYWNSETGEASWEMPEEVAAAEAAAPYGSEEWFKAETAADHTALTDRSARLRTFGAWQEMRDPESGVVYYWNTDTDETTWEVPAEVEAALAADAQAQAGDAHDAASTTRPPDEAAEAAEDATLAWVPPPIEVGSPTPRDSPREELRRKKERDAAKARAEAEAKAKAGADADGDGKEAHPVRVRPGSAASSVGGDTIYADVARLPRALRTKLKRIEREEFDYKDRVAHVRYLTEQLADGDFLTASGIADQIASMQNKARDAAARRAALEAKKAKEAEARQAQLEAERLQRLAEEEAARKAAEEERARLEREEKERAELARIRDEKLRKKAEAERLAAEEEARQRRLKAAEEAREEEETLRMVEAEEESRASQHALNLASEEWYAELLQRREEEAAAAEAAQRAADERLAALAAEEAEMDAKVRRAAAEVEMAQEAAKEAAAASADVNERERLRAALPRGWAELEAEDGTVYFLNAVTMETTYERPVADVEGATSKPGTAGSAATAATDDAGGALGADAPPTPAAGAAAGATAGAAEAEASEWQEVTDPGTGQTYYWNPRTQESSWEAPTGAALSTTFAAVAAFGDALDGGKAAETLEAGDAGAWAAVPSDDGTYYYNQVSGEVTWDPPPGFEPAVQEWSAAGRRIVRGSDGDRYEEVADEADGTFYYRLSDGTSHWTLP